MRHPDELLAAFVEGTASLPERAAVQAHLSFCPSCREEVDLAGSARAALQALPELEPAPLDLAFAGGGLAPAAPEVGSPAPSTESTESTGPFVEAPAGDFTPLPIEMPSSRPPTTSTGRRWPVRVAQGALAVAAVSVAVAVFVGGRSPSQTGSTPQSRAAAPTAPSKANPVVGASTQSFTHAAFLALANDLVREVRRGVSFDASSPALSPEPSPASDAPLTEQAASCIDRGTGVVAGTRLYYVQRAAYEGTDAYIGAFLTGTGTSRSLLVLAVSVDGCSPLQFIRQHV
jgi:hypothetical protein